jgi:hypothetical protein
VFLLKKNKQSYVEKVFEGKNTEQYSYDGYVVDDKVIDVPAIRPNMNQTEIIQSTELGQALEQLNKDDIDPGTKMSSIDMRSRLEPQEISQLTAVDFLVCVRFLSGNTLNLTRQIKRLKVSEKGKGREEQVRVIAGKKEQDKMTNMNNSNIKNGMGVT